MAQITLNSSGVASDGALVLQSNGTTTAVTINTSQNVGVGVTPSAWSSTAGAIQMPAGVATSRFGFSQNVYYDGSNYKAITTSTSSLYQQSSGQHIFYTAPSVTAGSTATFTQAMTLDASGRLGIGATSPSGKLVVVGGNSNTAILDNDNSQYTQLLLQRNSTANTGGDLLIDGTNATMSLRMLAVGAMRFCTSTSAGDGTERMRIDSSGNLLVGTTDAGDATGNGIKLKPNGDGAGFARLNIVTAATTNAQNNGFSFYSTGASAYRFYVGAAGTVFATNTTISAISDIRYKENVRDLDVGLNAIMSLKPRKFDWKAGKGKDTQNDRGFIAQEFEQVFPDLIDEWKDPAPKGEEPYKSVRADLIPVLVKAIQEQQAIITALQADVAALKNPT